MKKVLSLVLLGILLFSVGCGCGGDDSTDEPTPTTVPTPTETEEVTPGEPESGMLYWFDDTTNECGLKEFTGLFMYQGLQTFATLEECEAALAERPAPTTTPEPTGGADSTETVLAPIMDNLIIAFAEVDGTIQGYAIADIQKLTELQQGGAYWMYATEQTSLDFPDFVKTLFVGWNTPAWMSEDAIASIALGEYTDTIPFVIGWDASIQEFTVYMSSAVEPLTEIPVGQEYCTFTAEPGDNFGERSCQTR